MTNDYITKDFPCAAFLLATENKLKSYTKADGITRFVFAGSKTLDELVRQFYTQTAVVNVTAFCYAQRTLKGIIYDACNMKDKTNVEQSESNK